jgi:uncharacterized lipoprotein YmbA
MHTTRIAASMGLMTALFLAAGCATTPPSEFYTLSPMPDASSASIPGDASALSLGVGPVLLPDYLDAPQLVTRPTPNRLEMAEFHRWGGSLAGSVAPVLTQNLSLLLGTEDVVIYPWDDPVDPDYRVRLEMLRFDGTLGGTVELDTRWEVVGRHPADRYRLKLLGAGRAVLSEPVGGDTYEDLVAAQSRALGSLSRELASRVREAANPGTRAR